MLFDVTPTQQVVEYFIVVHKEIVIILHYSDKTQRQYEFLII